jgi:DNA replicative helicase MCM subunit Mcm2 (Cdc46/Mcm family)
MASGTIHYNKGGFNLQLTANTTIIACSNPVDYLYDFHKSLHENVNLPLPLLSRFDLQVNMLATKPVQEERKILDHIIKVREKGIDNYVKEENLLSEKELLTLLNHVKNLKPVMSQEAAKMLEEFQLYQMQVQNKYKTGKIIDNRFFEAMYRLATAYAKLHLSATVRPEHAAIVIDIYKRTLETFHLPTEMEEKSTQVNMDGKATNFNDAIMFTAQKLEKDSSDGFFNEKDFVKLLCADYPDMFPNEMLAQRAFDKRLMQNQIAKHGDRYKYG